MMLFKAVMFIWPLILLIFLEALFFPFNDSATLIDFSLLSILSTVRDILLNIFVTAIATYYCYHVIQGKLPTFVTSCDVVCRTRGFEILSASMIYMLGFFVIFIVMVIGLKQDNTSFMYGGFTFVVLLIACMAIIKFIFTLTLVTVKDISAADAFQESWRLTDGQWWRVAKTMLVTTLVTTVPYSLLIWLVDEKSSISFVINIVAVIFLKIYFVIVVLLLLNDLILRHSCKTGYKNLSEK